MPCARTLPDEDPWLWLPAAFDPRNAAASANAGATGDTVAAAQGLHNASQDSLEVELEAALEGRLSEDAAAVVTDEHARAEATVCAPPASSASSEQHSSSADAGHVPATCEPACVVSGGWPPKPHVSKTSLDRWSVDRQEHGFAAPQLKKMGTSKEKVQSTLNLRPCQPPPSAGSDGASDDTPACPQADATLQDADTVPGPVPQASQSDGAPHVAAPPANPNAHVGHQPEQRVTAGPSDPSRNRRIVRSISEAFMLDDDAFQQLLDCNDEDGDGEDLVLDVWSALQSDSLSTAFSGVEAAGAAVNGLRSTWAARTGLELGPIKILHQVEWNSACLKELLPSARLHDTCCFENIVQFFRPEIKDTVERCLQQPQLAVEILSPLLAAGRATCREAWCVTHKKVCQVQPANRHVAGTSCKPYSRKGSRMGQTDPEVVFTLAWLGLRLDLMEPEILSESVRTIGQAGIGISKHGDACHDVCDAGLGNLILRLMAPHYHLECIVLDPTMFGFPFSREREFIKMRHKVKTLHQVSPLSRFVCLCADWQRCVISFDLHDTGDCNSSQETESRLH